VIFGGMAHRIHGDVSDVVVDELVRHLSAPPGADDEPSAAQHPEMLGDKGLGYPGHLHQLVDTTLASGELDDDCQAHRIAERPQELRCTSEVDV